MTCGTTTKAVTISEKYFTYPAVFTQLFVLSSATNVAVLGRREGGGWRHLHGLPQEGSLPHALQKYHLRSVHLHIFIPFPFSHFIATGK